MTWKTVFQTYQNPEIGKIKKRDPDLKKLKSFLGKDWDAYKNNPEALKLWADLLFTNNLMKQGQVPSNFTAITRCNSCGYVYVPSELTNDGSVLGCPWCWNRVKGLPIPKPVTTHQRERRAYEQK